MQSPYHKSTGIHVVAKKGALSCSRFELLGLLDFAKARGFVVNLGAEGYKLAGECMSKPQFMGRLAVNNWIGKVPEHAEALCSVGPKTMWKSGCEKNGSCSLDHSLDRSFRHSIGLWSVRSATVMSPTHRFGSTCDFLEPSEYKRWTSVSARTNCLKAYRVSGANFVAFG